MPAARYSKEFKAQVVREVIEKERTISSVASSYDLAWLIVEWLGCWGLVAVGIAWVGGRTNVGV